MLTHEIKWKGHQWLYVYECSTREILIHQIYRDSRRPEGGFPLFYVYQAMKAIRG